MRRVGKLALAFVLLVGVFGASSAQAPAALVDPSFRVQCDYSHSAPDDPIVFPYQPGASHLHEFFGNTTTDAFSTLASMRGGDTTCSDTLDRSGYWVPAVYQNGAIVHPDFVALYYRAGYRDPQSIQPFPAGLRVVAGNAKALGPQDKSVMQWTCVGVGIPSPNGIPICFGTLVLKVFFPDCWDGKHLDSVDHKVHLAYAVQPGDAPDRVCPPTHPVAVPAIQMEVNFNARGGSGLTLSSGPGFTAHADFFNAWDQGRLAARVRCSLNRSPVPCVDDVLTPG
jgi:hypothetical protein